MPKITRHGGPSDTTVSDVEPLPDSVLVDAETGDERTDSEREADDNAQAAPDELDAERPAVNASKAEWVAYAVTRGEDRADAASWTKAELIDLYGPNGSPAG